MSKYVLAYRFVTKLSLVNASIEIIQDHDWLQFYREDRQWKPTAFYAARISPPSVQLP